MSFVQSISGDKQRNGPINPLFPALRSGPTARSGAYPKSKFLAASSARILPVDTVVLSRTASVGFVSILGKPMATSQDFVNWIPGDELSPRFLLHALRASHRYLVSNASGAIHKTLYMPAAKDFHILLPDLPMQDRIVRQLDAQLAAQADIRRAAETELEAIRSLPAAVIREVFTAK